MTQSECVSALRGIFVMSWFGKIIIAICVVVGFKKTSGRVDYKMGIIS